MRPNVCEARAGRIDQNEVYAAGVRKNAHPIALALGMLIAGGVNLILDIIHPKCGDTCVEATYDQWGRRAVAPCMRNNGKCEAS